MDYYRMQNIQADTDMRDSISGSDKGSSSGKKPSGGKKNDDK
jgi:uncharacterized protein YqfA (UPF0365 family)